MTATSIVPQLVSVLSHVSLLLFSILVAVLSVWIQHRVQRAAAKHPFDNPPTLSSPPPYSSRQEKSLQSGRSCETESSSPRASRQSTTQPSLKRAYSENGALTDYYTVSNKNNVTRYTFARSFGSSRAPASYYSVSPRSSFSTPSSPSCISDSEDEKLCESPFGPDITAPTTTTNSPSNVRSDSSFDQYWLSDGEEPNSPTGSLLDEYKSGASWLPAASEILMGSQATCGRKIIGMLGFARAAIGLPVLIQMARFGSFPVSTRLFVFSGAKKPMILLTDTWILAPQLTEALLFNYDLLILDFVMSTCVSKHHPLYVCETAADDHHVCSLPLPL